jgi:hypothetical protein
MKILFIIIAIILTLFIVFQIYISMSIFKTENQAYQVIREEKTFEIRYYPAATMAMVTSNLKSYRDLGSSGFGTLAKYIFGGNSEKKQIAMTAPVHMDIGDSVSTMSFVMPAKYQMTDLPKPDNASVILKTSEPEYVAVIQFGGFASTDKIEKYQAKLEKALQEQGLSYHGNFRFLGYNPPFQLFGRRNEVIVALDANEIEQQK